MNSPDSNDCQAASPLWPVGVTWILLDIEGTTCPVSFVAETLFPYASRNLGLVLKTAVDRPDVRELVQEVDKAWAEDPDPAAKRLRQQLADTGAGMSCLPYLQWLISEDRKLPALKELQGMVWQQGYAAGELQAPLFDDVAPALQRWHASGMGLAVYSSGSVAAQQLLYGHTAAGDLRPIFEHWFDTRTGPKLEVNSYRTIATCLACAPASVLFISDVKAELKAAHAAGMQVLFSQRPGNPEQAPGPFHVIRDYSALDPRF